MLGPYQMDHSVPIRPQRKRLRWSEHDYSAPAMYFVTTCVHDRACLFGEVIGDNVRRTPYGDAVETCWRAIPDHFRHAALDVWVTMPNHFHGILTVVGAEHARPDPEQARPDQSHSRPGHPPVSIVVRSFKSAVTKRINELRGTPGTVVWQRSFHEHVIRDHADLIRIRNYIADNPAQWAYDDENPSP